MGRPLFVLFCVFVSGIQWSHPSVARPRRRLVRAVSPKEVYDGGTQGPQLSRLVSALGAEEEGGEGSHTTCVAVISKDTSAVPSVNVCKKCVILPTTGVLSKMFTARETSGTLTWENHKGSITLSTMHKTWALWIINTTIALYKLWIVGSEEMQWFPGHYCDSDCLELSHQMNSMFSLRLKT